MSVETDLSRGLHSFSMVGLPGKAVDEAKDRVSSAVKNSGFDSPKSKNQKITVSLSPADLRKEGSLFDLPIALSYLLAAEAAHFLPEKKIFLGELGLDGTLRPVRGALPLAEEARRRGFTEIFLPEENAEEAALLCGISVFGSGSLREVLDHLSGEKKIPACPLTVPKRDGLSGALEDFVDIKGQESAKRGLEIAAAGGHNIAMYGPPGTGKTMLARAFSGILPDLSMEESLEVTGIHSIAGIGAGKIVTCPPFRSPHHTASYVSLVGGGAYPKPGEVTLAHRGVLFLDEFPEFEQRSIEALREPMEENFISITRARKTAIFPSNFILVAAMNPCPCGNYLSDESICRCSPLDLVRYNKKISGPIIDRIDLWVSVGKIDYEKLGEGKNGEESGSIKARVLSARETQRKRFEKAEPGIRLNSDIKAKDILKLSRISAPALGLLNQSAERLALSARAYHRVIKVARTIADLRGDAEVSPEHVLEALQYRPKFGG